MAYRLGRRTRNLLLAIHVLPVMAFFGGTLSMLLLQFGINGADSREQLHYTLVNMHVIDDTMIKFPAMAVLLSGLLLCIWTQWGLVKYYWVLIKIVLTILVILIGILFVSDWFSFLVETVDHYGFASLQEQEFQTTRSSLMLAAIFNNAALALMTIITSFKPFGRIKKA